MISNAAVEDSAPQVQEIVRAILALMRGRTGCDFTRYRPATIHRRIRNRMIAVGITSIADYLDRLRDDDTEAAHLLERLTIKVSRFYRNPSVFDFLRRDVIPRLRQSADTSALRVWSAGCGCGEEAYTLAMLLDEAGIAGVVEASDIDPAALAAADAGVYPTTAAADLPPELATRYLERVDGGRHEVLRVRKSLRDRVRFHRHDIITPVPPSLAAFDLVCCRNVLIYFQRDVQEQTLAALCNATRPGGVLCLGEAEWPSPAVARLLDPIGQRMRCFVVRESATISPAPVDRFYRRHGGTSP